MTDQQALFGYRIAEADETLADAKALLQNGRTPRSVVNRAYYSMFYGVLALFIAEGIEHRFRSESDVSKSPEKIRAFVFVAA